MGIINGLVSIFVSYWFYNTAISVKKPALKWAAIGFGIFLAIKLVGYWGIASVQTSAQSAQIDSLIEKGYQPTEHSKRKVFLQNNQPMDLTFLAVISDILPMILAVIGAAFVRAKFILGTGIMASLKKGSGGNSDTNDTGDDG